MLGRYMEGIFSYGVSTCHINHETESKVGHSRKIYRILLKGVVHLANYSTKIIY